MKNITFDTYSELIDECLELLESKDSIAIYADETLATEILEMTTLSDYKEHKVEFSGDVDTYLISKIGNEFFCIEPAVFTEGTHIGEYKYAEPDYMILFADAVINNYEEIVKIYEGDIQTIFMDYDEFDLDDEDFEEEDECDCPECTVLKFTEKILESCGRPECIENILKEFLGTIIDHIVVEDIEDED